jgi:hypothetical protein
VNDLLAELIQAHGGQDRWNELDRVSARLLQGGALWAITGQEDVLADVQVTAALHEERVSHSPFGAPGLRTAFTPLRIAILDANGGEVEALDDPRPSFAGHTLETPWSRLQLGYFVGCAMWTYLTQPFSFALPGFSTAELHPVEVDGARLRRLEVTWPGSLATHSTRQTVYVDDDGLLVRHDYDVEIAGNTPGAHFLSNYIDVNGIKVPARHRIYPRQPDGVADLQTLVVSIDLEDIRFA